MKIIINGKCFYDCVSWSLNSLPSIETYFRSFPELKSLIIYLFKNNEYKMEDSGPFIDNDNIVDDKEDVNKI